MENGKFVLCDIYMKLCHFAQDYGRKSLTWAAPTTHRDFFYALRAIRSLPGVPAKSQISWGGSESDLRVKRKNLSAAERRTARMRGVSN